MSVEEINLGAKIRNILQEANTDPDKIDAAVEKVITEVENAAKNQDNSSNGMKSDLEHMFDLLATAKGADMGRLNLSVRDAFFMQDKLGYNDTKFNELTQALVNVGFFEESQGYFLLTAAGYEFCQKIENENVWNKISSDIDANKSLSITDVKNLVEKYHNELIGL